MLTNFWNEGPIIEKPLVKGSVWTEEQALDWLKGDKDSFAPCLGNSLNALAQFHVEYQVVIVYLLNFV